MLPKSWVGTWVEFGLLKVRFTNLANFELSSSDSCTNPMVRFGVDHHLKPISDLQWQFLACFQHPHLFLFALAARDFSITDN
jgi:hypothetical protein